MECASKWEIDICPQDKRDLLTISLKNVEQESILYDKKGISIRLRLNEKKEEFIKALKEKYIINIKRIPKYYIECGKKSIVKDIEEFKNMEISNIIEDGFNFQINFINK